MRKIYNNISINRRLVKEHRHRRLAKRKSIRWYAAANFADRKNSSKLPRWAPGEQAFYEFIRSYSIVSHRHPIPRCNPLSLHCLYDLLDRSPRPGCWGCWWITRQCL